MIIVDTNVVSEPLRRAAEPAVQDWLDRQVPETLFLATVSLAELLAGVALLPAGRRRDGLVTGMQALLTGLFGSRMLPFDEPAATAYADIVARTRTAGITISVPDAQIAAIAAVHGFAVATRDVTPFQAAGIPVINPWPVRPA